jgi:dienelactone hydrolase
MEKWEPDAKGNWAPVNQNFVAWAKYRANRQGELDLGTAKPTEGSYTKPGALGLLWSGYREGAKEIPANLPKPAFDRAESGQNLFTIHTEDNRSVSARFNLGWSAKIERVPVQVGNLNGYFAFPKGATAQPVVINLHGSEGGNFSGAEARAYQFASRGIPCLALNYFAYANEAIPGVPTTNLKTPVEVLDEARQWLTKRPEADAKRIGIYGVSKGAEFSVVGASCYPWIKAVVAMVPSDVVWEGYPLASVQTGDDSTWSFGGKGLPYIPLFAIDTKKYRVNTDRYEASRTANPAAAKAAEIPIENSPAKFLLVGGDRDEVWASGKMARLLKKRMDRAGKGKQVQVLTFDKAGHQLSGDGTFPVRLYGVQSADPRDKILNAEGEGTALAWERVVTFLKENL